MAADYKSPQEDEEASTSSTRYFCVYLRLGSCWSVRLVGRHGLLRFCVFMAQLIIIWAERDRPTVALTSNVLIVKVHIRRAVCIAHSHTCCTFVGIYYVSTLSICNQNRERDRAATSAWTIVDQTTEDRIAFDVAYK